METGEQALLRIIASHLEVTEKLLDVFIPVASAVRQHPDLQTRLPAFAPKPTLQELRASTAQLRQR